ncbi:MAG: hypothetical protein E6I19_12355 [Chloroflexi bacterium]|nr:MAG: hypothetical protein E6I19_12355 [Chloroflexota bacterium]
MDLTTLAIAATPSFIASAVEFVEAATIVLAVGVTRGWRAPLVGTVLAALTLAVIVGTLGVALVNYVPERLLLGIYKREVAELRAQGLKKTEWDWVGTIVSYKAVLLEGTEVAFIVISFGAKGVSAMSAAIWGAVAAGVIVTGLAAAIRGPLTAVPENLLKFIVGAMLTTFGIFWFGEGVGAEWPGDALSIPVILALVLATSWASVRMLNVIVPEGAHVEARNV